MWWRAGGVAARLCGGAGSGFALVWVGVSASGAGAASGGGTGVAIGSAGPGWDPCTGLGAPDGQALLTALHTG